MCTPTPAMVVSALAGVRAEVDGMAAAVAQVKAAGPLSGKPVLILSRPMAPRATPTDALWAKAQKDLAARYPGALHLVAPGGTHNIHLTQQAWFVQAIEEFLRRGC